MKVLVASSEIVPFAKTGGLASRSVDRKRCSLRQAAPPVRVPLGHREEIGVVMETDAGEGVRGYLVRNDRYFDREFLYGTKDGDYVDHCERFAFFCRAIMEWI